jgi:hemolysin III
MATELDELTTAIVRPRLRGRLHQMAFVASVVGLVWLVRSATGARALTAAWVYGISSAVAYLASSLYHGVARPGRVKWVLRRCDHCTIFLLIAGTFTPICLLTIRGTWCWVLLTIMWSGALGGIAFKVAALERYRRVGGALYLILGWMGLLVFPALIHRPLVLGLVVAGGLLYTVGAVLFFLKVPRLSPRWFGYHEVWHVFGVLAGALLFVANLHLVRLG